MRALIEAWKTRSVELIAEAKDTAAVDAVAAAARERAKGWRDAEWATRVKDAIDKRRGELDAEGAA